MGSTLRKLTTYKYTRLLIKFKKAVIAIIILFVSLQFATATCFLQDPIDLFNGKSLAGWEYFLVDPDVKMTDVWTVRDKLLICKGEPMGYLATKKEYTNYRLIVEWRWAPGNPGGNSGVLMRITGEPQALPSCVEAQLQHGNAGAIFGFHGFPVKGDTSRMISNDTELTGKLSGVLKIKANEKEPGEWNKYDITLKNSKLTLFINGEKVNEANGLEVTAGKIGLQSEGGEIHFRTIQLIPLDSKQSEGKHEWPQFHGPNRDNKSLETGLLTSWPEKGPDMVWTANGLGHGFSSVSVANGIIYTAGNIEENTVVTALNMDGQLLWQVKNGKAWTKSYPGTRSTPTIDGNRVYHQNPFGNIICLEAKTGEIIWEKDILTEMDSKSTKWALAESLLIDGENLISCPGGPETCMVALNKNTGEIVWKAPSTDELAGYSCPILVEYQGKRIVVTLTAKAIIGVNADNGELFWHVKHVSYADENVMMPFFKDGSIFISTIMAGSVKWKINVDEGKVSLEELWRTKELDNHHGSVMLIDGYLYGTSTVKNRDLWLCLDWETGETKYITEGTGKSSMTYADGRLYTLSINRLVGLVKPTSSNFNVISTFEIPEGGEGLSWAHPVVCDGHLYIRHGEFLYTYRVRK